MTARRVALLLVAGIALVVIAVWLASQRHLEHASLAGDLVLPGLESNVNNVTEVRLRRGDGTHTTLKRAAGGWLVGERDWPADIGKVRKLLFDLGALNVVEEKTRLPANYPQLGVEDVGAGKSTGTEVDAVTPTRTFALIVGKSSSGKSGYVRVSGTAPSLLAAPLLIVNADPKSWLDHSLVDLPVTRVRAVEERPAAGPAYTASRDKKEQTDFAVSPLPKKRELESPAVADEIGGALGSLSLDDVHKGAAPADAKLARALYRTFDGLELEVAGRKDGSRPLVAFSARSTDKATEAEAARLNARLGGWEFEIPEYKYNAMFRPLEELLKKPPEPAHKPPRARAPAKPPAKAVTK
ncbi:MAG TPA: DUF4340 domain-containing protein [Steroidobacteraceae bacterium]|nr:DUF4340 domain-containing protein [Steroidobacteraceae bacterium]